MNPVTSPVHTHGLQTGEERKLSFTDDGLDLRGESFHQFRKSEALGSRGEFELVGYLCRAGLSCHTFKLPVETSGEMGRVFDGWFPRLKTMQCEMHITLVVSLLGRKFLRLK